MTDSLEIRKLERWEILMNTKDYQTANNYSDRRGPCLAHWPALVRVGAIANTILIKDVKTSTRSNQDCFHHIRPTNLQFSEELSTLLWPRIKVSQSNPNTRQTAILLFLPHAQELTPYLVKTRTERKFPANPRTPTPVDSICWLEDRRE